MGDFEAWTPVQVESPLKYHPCKIDFLTLIFFKQKTAYEILSGLVGSEMCIRDRKDPVHLYYRFTLDFDFICVG